jgi:uncharacterized damage-inducible protein DinB
MTADHAKCRVPTMGQQLRQEGITACRAIAAVPEDRKHPPVVADLVFCRSHRVHQRGQLSTYLRPMGSKRPAIYGSSFDEKFQG